MTKTPERILVIKLGALGDFFYALGPMKAIRSHHKDAHITLLTQKPYVDLARKSGYFDDIILDARPKYNPADWLSFRAALNAPKFSRVYDLQNNDRTSLYFKLFSPKPEWVGVAKGASHRNTDPERSKFHAFLGHRNTLNLAGIKTVNLDPLDWLTSDISQFGLSKPYALLVPGSSAKRPNKRWPVNSFRNLAEDLISQGLTPVLIASDSERDLADQISKNTGIINLAGKTDFDMLLSLARDAVIAIGNDTGPMHMISMTGCPVVMFFRSDESTIRKHGPQSANAVSFEKNDLSEIPAKDVLEASLSLKRD